MKLLGLIFAMMGVANLIMGYYVATDKKKLSKTAQVINYIIIAIFLFDYAITVALR